MTPDPDFLQQVIATMQSQRNQALDALAVVEARNNILSKDLAKAEERKEKKKDEK